MPIDQDLSPDQCGTLWEQMYPYSQFIVCLCDPL